MAYLSRDFLSIVSEIGFESRQCDSFCVITLFKLLIPRGDYEIPVRVSGWSISLSWKLQGPLSIVAVLTTGRLCVFLTNTNVPEQATVIGIG